MELIISLVLYNSSDHQLRRLFFSLERQKNVKFVLLILDNASQNSALFHEYAFPINYLQSFSNVGFGKAHNINFKRSGEMAPFFLVINPDVYFDDPLLLRKALDRMQGSPEVTLSSVGVRNPDGSIQQVHRLLPRFADICRRFILNKLRIYSPYKHTYTLSHIDKSRPFRCPSVSGCFMLFRSEAFQFHRGFDEQIFLYFEDIDLSRRCYHASKGTNVVYGDLSIYHSWNRQGYKNMETFKIHVLSAVYYFQKYGIFRDEYSKKENMKIEAMTAKR